MGKEVGDIALKEYKFSPPKINVNGTEVIDYTRARNGALARQPERKGAS